MTQEKIKLIDYSKYDKLFEDYNQRKPYFEKFKQEAQKVLDHPDVSEHLKNDVMDFMKGAERLQNGVENLQKRINELASKNINL